MPKPVSRSKRIIVVASATALGLGGAGLAFAYWSSTGTGVGEAQTGNSVEFTIASETPVGTLAPGSAGQTIAFTVTNPGPATQALSAVTVDLATADGTPWVPTGTCLAADYTATITTPPAYGPIPAAGELDGVITVTLASTAVNQDDCKGQAVPLYLEAS